MADGAKRRYRRARLALCGVVGCFAWALPASGVYAGADEHFEFVANRALSAVFCHDDERAGRLAASMVEIARDFERPYPHMADALLVLSMFHNNQGRFAEAEAALRQSLAIVRDALGPHHRDYFEATGGLAHVLVNRGLARDAERTLRGALRDIQTVDDRNTTVEQGRLLAELGNVYWHTGRRDRARETWSSSYQRLSSWPLMPDAELADVARRYGVAIADDGEYRRARRMLDWSAAVFGANYARRTDCEDQLKLFNWTVYAWNFWEGANEVRNAEVDVDYVRALSGQAWVEAAQGRIDESARRSELALETLASNSRENSVLAYEPLLLRAHALHSRGRNDDALRALDRAVQVLAPAYSPVNPLYLIPHYNRSRIHAAQDEHEEAFTASRRAAVSFAESTKRLYRSTDGRSDAVWGDFGLHHLELLERSLAVGSVQSAVLQAEAFDFHQTLQLESARDGLPGVASRIHGDNELGGLAREHLSVLREIETVDVRAGLLASRIAKYRDHDAVAAGKRRAQELQRARDALEARMGREFPRYQALIAPTPVALAEARALLGPAEALISYVVRDHGAFAWVVRRDAARMLRLDTDRRELESLVATLRRGLDVAEREAGAAARPFSLAAAHALYRKLVTPAETSLGEATRILVVPDGPLLGLPFVALLRERPPAGAGPTPEYGSLAWLGRDFAVAVLPSVSTLRATRVDDQQGRGTGKLVGDREQRSDEDRRTVHGVDIDSPTPYRFLASHEALRLLPRPPPTAHDLDALAALVGAGETTLGPGSRAYAVAEESRRSAAYPVFAVASHAVIGGEFGGLTEPGLVLAPRSTTSPDEKALLAASEIAALRLEPDLVVFLAGRTTNPDGTPAAQGLRALARCLIHAGSAALLIPHWEVEPDAVGRLLGRLRRERLRAPGTGRAEALQRAILTLLDDDTDRSSHHPAYWAHYMLVGDGGAS